MYWPLACAHRSGSYQVSTWEQKDHMTGSLGRYLHGMAADGRRDQFNGNWIGCCLTAAAHDAPRTTHSIGRGRGVLVKLVCWLQLGAGV